jgi:hypothetical protein
MIPLAEWTPFVTPPPGLWDYWPALLLPLVVAVSIVYKSIRCESMSQVPRQAASISLWIIAGLVLAALVLWLIVAAVTRLAS